MTLYTLMRDGWAASRNFQFLRLLAHSKTEGHTVGSIARSTNRKNSKLQITDIKISICQIKKISKLCTLLITSSFTKKSV